MPFNEKDIGAIDINVRKAKVGDKEAFKKLIEENKISMYRVSKAILNKEEDIEDAIGESILKAYKNISSLRNEAYFKTWLIRIVINESNNIYKKRNREIAMDKEHFINMEHRDFYKDFSLYDAINSLEDLKYKDIAKLLKIKEGTVKSRLSRAKQKLYEILKED